MSKKYPFVSSSSPRVEEMPTVPATTLKNSTADILDQVSGGKAFAITRHDKARAVILSAEQYDSLVASQTGWLDSLQKQYQHMLEDMQSPEQKAAAQKLFRATPEELGAHAVLAAQKKLRSRK